MINVTVWNEYLHEKSDKDAHDVYPNGIHACIAEFLQCDDIFVTCATLEMENCGLSDELINSTDVFIWWGHMAHERVPDEIVEKVHDAVLRGAGLIVLHSGHFSKIFKKVLGTTCSLCWRDGDRERVWCCNPSHPIAKGIPLHFELPREEMYGERFDIPQPDELVFMGWFSGGEVFRSGCTFNRGLGKIFYFQPGHETNPTYYNEYVQKIITNAVYWANSVVKVDKIECPQVESLENK